MNLKKAIYIRIGVEFAKCNMITLERHQDKAEDIHSICNRDVRKKNVQNDIVNQNISIKCNICGRRGHERNECRIKDAICFGCGKTGHLKTMCRGHEAKEMYAVIRDSNKEEENVYSMFNISTEHDGVIMATIHLNKLSCKLQVDTWAPYLLYI